MSANQFSHPSPDSPLVVLDTGALSAKSRDLWVLADDEPLVGLPTAQAARRGPVLHQYRRTEELIPGTNVVPFLHPIYRRRIPPETRPSPSSEQLRSRAEVRWLVYGAGMFVLGILAHMAWLRAWL